MFPISKENSKKLKKEIPDINIFKTKRKHYIEDGVLFERDIQTNIDNLNKLVNAYKIIDQSDQSRYILQNLKYNLNKQIKILKGFQK